VRVGKCDPKNLFGGPWRAVGRRVLRLSGGQRGGALVEALVAVSLLAGVFTMALQGLATGSRAMGTIGDLTAAQNIARSQLEYALNAAYCTPPCSFSTIAAPTGYTVTANAEAYPGETTLAYVVVTVSKDGHVLTQIKRLRADR
jgi:hypothetical protein